MKNAKIWAFVSGLFLAFDFTGMIAKDVLPQPELPKQKTDQESIASDWQKVGAAIHSAMVKNEQ